jgi:hypothetical protein
MANRKVIQMTIEPGKNGNLVSWLKKIQKHFLKTKSRAILIISTTPVDKDNRTLNVNPIPALADKPEDILNYLESAYSAVLSSMDPEQKEAFLHRKREEPGKPTPKPSAIITDLSGLPSDLKK